MLCNQRLSLFDHCGYSFYSCFLQVWRLRQRESGGRNPGLALPLGHRRRLLLLNVRRRPPVFDGRSPPAAGHRQGQRHPLLEGKSKTRDICKTTRGSVVDFNDLLGL